MLSLFVTPLSALAVNSADCPGKIALKMNSIRARVHTSYKGDADYKAGVKALNDMGEAQISYALTERKAKSCTYEAESGSLLHGQATLYTKSEFHPDENRWIPSDMLRTSFSAPGIRARFALTLTVERYSVDALEVYATSESDRTLMALLTDANGRSAYRRSGKVKYEVRGSR